MNRLRHKLTIVFLAATLLPTGAILWMGVALLQHSLGYVATDDVDRLSKSLESTARELYRQACENLKREAVAGELEAQKFAVNRLPYAPDILRQFWESGEAERCVLSGSEGDRLEYLVRGESEILAFSKALGGVRMEELKRQYQRARERVQTLRQRDLRKGFTRTLLLLSAVIWLFALISVVYMANRISRPIQDLTDGLHRLSGGDFAIRLKPGGSDEIGTAIRAFNHMAGHLEQNRDRLVYLTQIASWQSLARKMAHELKNSLTPIRLTVEEILARESGEDRQFLKQAAQLVIDEVESLERRLRAFSEFAAEPSVNPGPLDMTALVDERVQFLKVVHPDVHYKIEGEKDLPPAWADVDSAKGILTNLLENAAEAAGPGGTVCVNIERGSGGIIVEVHDSGPGLSEEARRSLFEPSISFKQRGMGLGLSISRKNALLAGGDLQNIEGTLGGAGFRLVLPVQTEENQAIGER